MIETGYAPNQTATIILLLLTGVFAAGIFFTGNKINERQADQLRKFDLDLKDKDVEIGNLKVRASALDLER